MHALAIVEPRTILFPMLGPPYPNPPIAEALVELHFAGGVEWSTAEPGLLHAFAEQYSGPRRELKTHEVAASWEKSGLRTTTSQRFSRWLLPDSSGLRLVGLGQGVLSVHVLAPYPGWASFRPLIDDAAIRFQAVCRPTELIKVGVRYIDQILVPEGADLEQYFHALPPQLPSQPRAISSFQVTTETVEGEVRALLTLVSGPSTGDGRRVIVYDLNLTEQMPPGASPTAWPEVVEKLHQRQKAMFEESIKDPTRELFR
ncbi:MAG: TIGR04255 family protein [Myxococcaceae bacterium]|nr:TIGR04255 family protein [Myxococcaceae bacterium]